METKIKRMAQFLFDNAGMIAAELERTESYRSLSIQFDAFKNKTGRLEVDLSLYQDVYGHRKLSNTAITPGRFKQLCNQLNEDADAVPLPEPVEVREEL